VDFVHGVTEAIFIF